MSNKELRTFERVFAYVLSKNPEYKYLYNDYCIQLSNDEYSICNWNLKDISEPTDEELEMITEEKIQETTIKIKDEAEAKDPIKVLEKNKTMLCDMCDKLDAIEATLVTIDARLVALESKVF